MRMLKFWIVVMFWAHQFTAALQVEAPSLKKVLSACIGAMTAAVMSALT